MRDRIFTPIFFAFAGVSLNAETMNVCEEVAKLETNHSVTTVFHPEYAVSNSSEK